MNAFLKKHSPTILSCVGSAGVVATAVLAVHATPKAIDIIKADSRKNHDGDPYGYTKLEAAKSAWTCYIPAAVMGASTIACIFGANVLNQKVQASLISAYGLLDQSFKEYKRYVGRVYGEDAEHKVSEAIAKDRYFEDKPHPSKDKQLFYDMFANRYFESTIPAMKKFESEFNKGYFESGYASLNDLYNFLDLPMIDGGDDIGWSEEAGEHYGYSEIEFEHELVTIDDGDGNEIPCYLLVMPYEPTADYIC